MSDSLSAPAIISAKWVDRASFAFQASGLVAPQSSTISESDAANVSTSATIWFDVKLLSNIPIDNKSALSRVKPM